MSHEHAKSHVKTYVAVYISLLVLVVLTVAVAHVKLGSLGFPVAMSIAALKTFLIIAVFMHVKDEFPLIQVFAVLGIFWLPLLFVFMFSDYFTRSDNRAVPHNSAHFATTHDAGSTSH